jgi:hypothetical protein
MPGLMRVAPVLGASNYYPKIEHPWIRTGQYCDTARSDVLFPQLELPARTNPGVQTRVMIRVQ